MSEFFVSSSTESGGTNTCDPLMCTPRTRSGATRATAGEHRGADVASLDGEPFVAETFHERGPAAGDPLGVPRLLGGAGQAETRQRWHYDVEGIGGVVRLGERADDVEESKTEPGQPWVSSSATAPGCGDRACR